MSILIKPAYDSDASAYFTTAGVTSTAGRQQISRFVTGIKNLGLWNSMVCWPLRSSQNAGTGTIAYSLGGLGTFNGTLTNGPTWGESGITFTASQFINLSSSLGSIQLHSLAFAVGSVSAVSGASRFFDIQDFGSSTRRNPFLTYQSFGSLTEFQLPNSSSGSQTVGVGVSTQLNTFLSFCGSKETSVMRYSINGVSQGTSGSKTFNVGSGYNSAKIAEGYAGTISFAMLASSDFSSSQVLSLHNLYKSTLGQGLGLP